ncbi:hypothetical protein MSG28_013135 [Choristoneura fumiferana]|uniref:Uncharacterized protein n=1 Tax=Choristoneura fumiferana TaxID=7141 RepID=A0ACC0KSD5_CHOFU|nr:hypothetical protein MSG28_013135 [Choristoneura fumiferana]
MAAMFLPILGMLVLSCAAQSPYFRRPVGYPVLEPTSTTTTTQSSDLLDRAGNDATTMSTTTLRLPPEALGNQAVVDALSKLPADRQPFWLLNRQALEEQRNKPHTFDQRPSFFIDSLSRQGSLVAYLHCSGRECGGADTAQTFFLAKGVCAHTRIPAHAPSRTASTDRCNASRQTAGS